MSDLYVAAAGAGKTTFLVNKALEQPNEKILITTFTDSNEHGIKEKFYQIILMYIKYRNKLIRILLFIIC